MISILKNRGEINCFLHFFEILLLLSDWQCHLTCFCIWKQYLYIRSLQGLNQPEVYLARLCSPNYSATSQTRPWFSSLSVPPKSQQTKFCPRGQRQRQGQIDSQTEQKSVVYFEEGGGTICRPGDPSRYRTGPCFYRRTSLLLIFYPRCTAQMLFYELHYWNTLSSRGICHQHH